MEKVAILSLLWTKADAVVSFMTHTPSEVLYAKPGVDVWSAAENVQHLIQSAQPFIRVLGRPASYFVEKWGQASYTSRSYEVMVRIYQEALGGGVQAPSAFVPILEGNDTEELIKTFTSTYKELERVFLAWSESDLENCLIPHPLLGSITLKEMMLFTVYHTAHHLQIMQSRGELVMFG
ncbi:DinB family protein [Runella sp. MFBS21]|uniref:DinB family protein n=1 Tax=Runella sp. MFBS21 TaxID=3034018 RepID=UPI0023F759F0|nr:DinB family protein [Runella sp. MFBS21]MDF7817843.1 DinB family protein [Runella sp. MFBS21]